MHLLDVQIHLRIKCVCVYENTHCCRFAQKLHQITKISCFNYIHTDATQPPPSHAVFTYSNLIIPLSFRSVEISCFHAWREDVISSRCFFCFNAIRSTHGQKTIQLPSPGTCRSPEDAAGRSRKDWFTPAPPGPCSDSWTSPRSTQPQPDGGFDHYTFPSEFFF